MADGVWGLAISPVAATLEAGTMVLSTVEAAALGTLTLILILTLTLTPTQTQTQTQTLGMGGGLVDITLGPNPNPNPNPRHGRRPGRHDEAQRAGVRRRRHAHGGP